MHIDNHGVQASILRRRLEPRWQLREKPVNDVVSDDSYKPSAAAEAHTQGRSAAAACPTGRCIGDRELFSFAVSTWDRNRRRGSPGVSSHLRVLSHVTAMEFDKYFAVSFPDRRRIGMDYVRDRTQLA